jgi:hypothetical protein
MEIYTLDAAYDREAVVEGYETLIWTERYDEFGDFAIVAEPSEKLIKKLPLGTLLVNSESNRIMIVEDLLVEDKNGTKKLTVTGRSMEVIFDTRVVHAYYYTEGTIGTMVTELVHRICVVPEGNSQPNDNFPGLVTRDDVPGGAYFGVAAVKVQSMYTAIESMCKSGDIGFCVELQPRSPRLLFRTYEGVLRQNVRFSTELDTLTNVSYFFSQKNYRNIAYVTHQLGANAIPDKNGSDTVSGFGRRNIAVDATDIDPNESPSLSDFQARLNQRAYEVLAQNRNDIIYDGEIEPNKDFQYRRDYWLGDVVTLYANRELSTQVRIKEHIWIDDVEGQRSYPTFVLY